MMKLTVPQQKELIPDEDVRAAFMRRQDVERMEPADREIAWEEHRIKLDSLRDRLSNLQWAVF